MSSKCYSNTTFFLSMRPRSRKLLRFLKHCYQRLKYGVSDEDSSSLDDYLASVIAQGCRDLANRGLGYPGSIEGNTPEDKQQNWVDILNKIAKGFEDYEGLESKPSNSLKESFYLLERHFTDLWD